MRRDRRQVDRASYKRFSQRFLKRASLGHALLNGRSFRRPTNSGKIIFLPQICRALAGMLCLAANRAQRPVSTFGLDAY